MQIHFLVMQNIDLNEIRAMPIEEVAAKLGIEVGRHKALCPFHQDRHPSLHFDIKRNRYKCFSCGASGNVIDLVMRYMNVGFKEAVEWMTNGSVQFEAKPQQTSYDKGKKVDVSVDTDYLNT